MTDMTPAFRDATRCRCGHDVSEHEPLPGHPDDAWECHGDGDACGCGKPDTILRGRERWA